MPESYRPDGTWSCTRDHRTAPCGDCDGCRSVQQENWTLLAEARRALNRSRAVDMIVRTLTFTDWARLSDDEVESVANRVLTQIEELTK